MKMFDSSDGALDFVNQSHARFFGFVYLPSVSKMMNRDTKLKSILRRHYGFIRSIYSPNYRHYKAVMPSQNRIYFSNSDQNKQLHFCKRLFDKQS